MNKYTFNKAQFILNKDFYKSKFKGDLIWNYFSLIILGLSGIGLNLLISFYYDASTLGAFNQVLATYIVFSMIGSGGINYSVLRAVSENINKKIELRDIVCGAILPTFFLAIFVSTIYFLLIGNISILLGSESVRSGMRVIVPGIFFFSLNKVLLSGVLNGLQKMKAYAFYQSLRYLIIFIGILFAIFFSVPGAKLPFIFSLEEFLLFIFLIIQISFLIDWWLSKNWIEWSKIHLNYGIRCFLSGVFIELNSRVDILMLGFFLSDYEVGIYSFSALFAEGFFQVLIVLQNNYNPILSRLISKKQFDYLLKKIKTGKKNTYLAIAILAVLSILIYPAIISFFVDEKYLASHLPFTILIIGILISSGYIPFQNILSMANFPGWHTVFMSSIILFNIFFNFLLIPILGINGAALATSSSLIVSCLVLKIMVKKILFIRI